MNRTLLTLASFGLTLLFGCGGKEPAPAQQASQPPANAVPAESSPPKAETPADKPPPAEKVEKPRTAHLIQAASLGKVNDVKLFLKSDPESISRYNESGFVPLHMAADNGHSEVIAVLLRAGADVNAPQETFQGTPLQYAAASGRLEAVQALLDAKATVDSVDTVGRTPLMWAATNGHASVVQALLDRGAKANRATPTGWTALRYAEKEGHEQVAELLRKQPSSAP